MAATSQPLEPLLVAVLDPTDDSRVLWTGRLKRSSAGQLNWTFWRVVRWPQPREYSSAMWAISAVIRAASSWPQA